LKHPVPPSHFSLFEAVLPDPTGDVAPTVLTVSELNRMARRALESQLPLLWVEGEISNFTPAASGHWYFSLKDATAQVRCVMFRTRNQAADFTPGNGDHVEIRALPSLYEAPGFARCLGIVTSPQAAALNDVLTALARRMPGLPVILYPTPVQGQGAGAQIAAAIRLACQRAECDVLLVCRGGGSLEDLWAFNDEAVVRAIVASKIPVVSGVGHETDFTLTDFVADVRGPTPTAAAELASPLRRDLLQGLRQQHARLSRGMARLYETHTQRLDHLARVMVHPADQLRRQQALLAQQAKRLTRAMHRLHERRAAQLQLCDTRLPRLAAHIGRQQQQLAMLHARLQRAPHTRLLQRNQILARLASNLAHLNPNNILARGYSVVTREGGQIVRDASTLTQGEIVNLRFHRGSATSEIETTS